MSLLSKIGKPGDVAELSLEERLALVDEVRNRIIEVVSNTGGHLASSLGVVELTVALLSVYSPPADKIIWDVGHQSYPWKLLTGRADRFHTIRQSGGLSGFPRMDESPCDAFGTGHSSTSISAALGYALARDLRGEKNRVIAIIGDGAMGAGMALEGLNHLGHTTTDMLIILNDNEMSISPNVGAISHHLTRLITDPRYNRIKSQYYGSPLQRGIMYNLIESPLDERAVDSHNRFEPAESKPARKCNCMLFCNSHIEKSIGKFRCKSVQSCSIRHCGRYRNNSPVSFTCLDHDSGECPGKSFAGSASTV